MQNPFFTNGLSENGRCGFMVTERTELRLCTNISNTFNPAAVFGALRYITAGLQWSSVYLWWSTCYRCAKSKNQMLHIALAEEKTHFDRCRSTYWILYLQMDISCRNTKQSVGNIITQSNFLTLKYVTDGWGTSDLGFKLVITAIKNISK